MTKLTREELKALIQKAEAHRLTISHLQDELDALTLRIQR